MNKAFLIVALLCLISFKGFSQDQLNDYKYILVPEQYEFQKDKNQYQLNALTKFLFEKYGFTALMNSDDYPSDLAQNSCLALKAMVIKDPGIFKTKLQVELQNCKGEVVYLTQVGETREKEYSRAYNLALRDAFQSFSNINYKYNNDINVTQTNQVITKSGPVKQVPKEAKAVMVDTQSDVDEAIVIIADEEPTSMPSRSNKDEKLLYAQPIDNGFQIVNTEPKKVMVIYYSGIADVFIVKGKDAIIYKKGDLWIYSETNGTALMVEELNIKF